MLSCCPQSSCCRPQHHPTCNAITPLATPSPHSQRHITPLATPSAHPQRHQPTRNADASDALGLLRSDLPAS
eukprot:597102-Prymnesium_polylepis.1